MPISYNDKDESMQRDIHSDIEDFVTPNIKAAWKSLEFSEFDIIKKGVGSP